jgi:hypothetical protein
VQEVAGAGPLVAVGRVPRRSRRPREAEAAKHLPDRGVAEAGGAGDEPRSPARLAATVADRPFELGGEASRAARGAARAIEQAGKALSLARTGLPPAQPPAVRGRAGDVEGRRGLANRAAACDREHELAAPCESELGVTVKAHLALLLADVWADAQPGRRAGLLRQPFTTCVGRTASQSPTMSSGRTGTRESSRPVAARKALTIAAVETTVGGSPTPLTP